MTQRIFALLIALLASAASADTPVEIPDDLLRDGKLKVEGRPGNEQPETFSYTRCELSSSREIYRASCGIGGEIYKTAKLNRDIRVRPGAYLLRYSSSVYPGIVVVKADETVVVKLHSVKIPRGDRRFIVRLFDDLGNAAQLRGFARWSWGTQSFDFDQRLCALNADWDTPGTRFGDNYCEPARTADFQTFVDGRYRVHADAGTSTVAFTYNTYSGRILVAPYWDYDGRNEIGHARSGYSLSVLAGTYGVTIKRESDGESADRYGIQVPGDDAAGVTTLRLQ